MSNQGSNNSQGSDNISREPAVHSTSQFVAQPQMEPNFIPCKLLSTNSIVKNRRKAEVLEDDLEVQILDEAKDSRKNSSKFIQNKWINDDSSGRGLTNL